MYINRDKHILIFGADGMLGNYFTSYLGQFYEVTGTTRDTFEVTGDIVHATEAILVKYKPSYAINCIGDIRKSGGHEQIIVNAYFPHVLSKLCFKLGIVLIHPTTDCVYSGYGTMYSNNGIPDSIDPYGLSKMLGETIDNACVIRTSIIGNERRGKSRSLVSWVEASAGTTVKGYTQHFWNGITCLEYAKFVKHLIDTDACWVGIKSVASRFLGQDFISKSDLVKAISEIYDLNVTVVPDDTTKCDRTLQGDIIVKRDLYDQIQEMKDYLPILEAHNRL